MATNRNPEPLLSGEFIDWVAELPIQSGDAWVTTLLNPAPERLLWCDECHYFHREVNECAYSPKAGA